MSDLLKKLKSYPVILPTWRDPRWLIVLFHGSFIVYAISSPGFARHPDQYLAAFLACVGCDFVFNVIFQRIWLFPLSGFITANGLFLILDSPTTWLYGVAGVMAMLVKQFVRPGGRHIFNPNNTGVVLALLLFGQYAVVGAGRWGGSASGAIVMAILGTLLVWAAGRMTLTISFVLTFVIGSFIRAALIGIPVLPVIAPATGSAFELFIFYNITDPATTPRSPRNQAIFGVLVGVLDAVMRFYEVRYSWFFALFFVSSLNPFMDLMISGYRSSIQIPERKAA